MMNKPLTTRQKQIYNAIKDFAEEHHRSPSEQELAAICNITDISIVSYNLLVLQSKGYIRMGPQLQRTIRIVKALEEV